MWKRAISGGNSGTDGVPAESPSILRTATRLGWVAIALILALLAQSILWVGNLPIPLKLAVPLMALLAYRRPVDALLLVAGIAPLAPLLTTDVWPMPGPVRLGEALVLAFLVGFVLRGWRHPWGARLPAGVWTPAVLFTFVVLASAAVQLGAL